MDLGLAGRACVVTGASRGIGLASARLLAAEGARVLLVARDEDALGAAAAECGRAGGEASPLALDVTAPDAGERLLDAARERFGALEVLVNNAGTSRYRALDELTDEDWQAQWELNVMAPMRLMRAAAPAMAERGWGRIVNVSSSAGSGPPRRTPPTRSPRPRSSRSRACSPTPTRTAACSSTRSRPGRSRRRCGWRPAGSPTSSPSARA